MSSHFSGSPDLFFGIASQFQEQSSAAKPLRLPDSDSDSVTSFPVEICLLGDKCHKPQHESLFFRKFPAEVQIMILFFAFGERTHYYIQGENGKPWSKDKRRTWALRETSDAFLDMFFTGTRCLIGRQPVPDVNTRSWAPYNVMIDGQDVGAMGWLSACHKSYHVGIKALNQKHTLRMCASHLLAQDSPERTWPVLMPKLATYMSNVTSIDLVLDPYTRQRANPDLAQIFEVDYKSLCLGLPPLLNLPSVRSLRLNMGVGMCQWYGARYVETLQELDEVLLNTLASTINVEDIHCEVHLPHWLYRDLFVSVHHPKPCRADPWNSEEYKPPRDYRWDFFPNKEDKGICIHPFIEHMTQADIKRESKVHPKSPVYGCCEPWDKVISALN